MVFWCCLNGEDEYCRTISFIHSNCIPPTPSFSTSNNILLATLKYCPTSHQPAWSTASSRTIIYAHWLRTSQCLLSHFTNNPGWVTHLFTRKYIHRHSNHPKQRIKHPNTLTIIPISPQAVNNTSIERIKTIADGNFNRKDNILN